MEDLTAAAYHQAGRRLLRYLFGSTLESECISTLGGCVAESMFTQEMHPCAVNGSGEERLHKLLAQISPWRQVQMAYRRYCARQAEALLRWHWPAVVAIAQALLDRSTLTDAEVAAIIEAVPARELREHRVRIDPQMVKQEREKNYCAVT